MAYISVPWLLEEFNQFGQLKISNGRYSHYQWSAFTLSLISICNSLCFFIRLSIWFNGKTDLLWQYSVANRSCVKYFNMHVTFRICVACNSNMQSIAFFGKMFRNKPISYSQRCPAMSDNRWLPSLNPQRHTYGLNYSEVYDTMSLKPNQSEPASLSPGEEGQRQRCLSDISELILLREIKAMDKGRSQSAQSMPDCRDVPEIVITSSCCSLNSCPATRSPTPLVGEVDPLALDVRCSLLYWSFGSFSSYRPHRLCELLET